MGVITESNYKSLYENATRELERMNESLAKERKAVLHLNGVRKMQAGWLLEKERKIKELELQLKILNKT